MPKILFVDHTAAMGGAELSLLDLANAYSKTSKVLLFEHGPLFERLRRLGVKVRAIKASDNILKLRASEGLNSLATIPELWQIAGQISQQAQGFDLILANSQKAFVVAALATLRGSPPVWWYLHDIITAKQFSRVNRLVAVFLANNLATKVLVNSQATGKAFVAAGGKETLLQVLYNGFDAQRFDHVAEQDVKKIRSQLNINRSFLIGLFSRLSYWKGQHILLEAIKNLPQVQVILVGEALFGEDEYVSKLRELATIPELAERVHWLGFRDDIPVLMKTCDIIVHTSTEPEPFGRVIVEGQLAQKPVIASAAGGALELIEDGVNGYLFSPGEAIALKKRIEQLISDRIQANTIAKQGYINAKTNFALENILETFAQSINKET